MTCTCVLVDLVDGPEWCRDPWCGRHSEIGPPWTPAADVSEPGPTVPEGDPWAPFD